MLRILRLALASLPLRQPLLLLAQPLAGPLVPELARGLWPLPQVGSAPWRELSARQPRLLRRPPAVGLPLSPALPAGRVAARWHLWRPPPPAPLGQRKASMRWRMPSPAMTSPVAGADAERAVAGQPAMMPGRLR